MTDKPRFLVEKANLRPPQDSSTATFFKDANCAEHVTTEKITLTVLQLALEPKPTKELESQYKDSFNHEAHSIAELKAKKANKAH